MDGVHRRDPVADPEDRLNLAGETPVIFHTDLKHDGRIRVADGRLFAHCADCVKAAVDNFNREFAIVSTEPSCLLHKASGTLVDLPPVSAAPLRPRAPWRFPFLIRTEELIAMTTTPDDQPPKETTPPPDTKPKETTPEPETKAPPSDD